MIQKTPTWKILRSWFHTTYLCHSLLIFYFIIFNLNVKLFIQIKVNCDFEIEKRSTPFPWTSILPPIVPATKKIRFPSKIFMHTSVRRKKDIHIWAHIKIYSWSHTHTHSISLTHSHIWACSLSHTPTHTFSHMPTHNGTIGIQEVWWVEMNG